MAERIKTYEVKLPEKLVRKASELLLTRGSDLDEFFRIQMRTLVKHNRFYALDDKYAFGKYDGESVDTVIRTDPEYVAWCLRTVAGFALEPKALELLGEMGVDL